MDMMRVAAVIAFILLFAPPGRAASENPPDDSAVPNEAVVQRLAALGKVWGKLRLLHPYLPYRDIDLDRALAENLDAIETAGTTEELEAALNGFLDVFNDPLTVAHRVAHDSPIPGNPAENIDRSIVRDLGDGVMLIDATDYRVFSDYAAAIEKIKAQLAKHAMPELLVFDLRYLNGGGSPDSDRFYARWSLSSSGVFDLVSRNMTGPAERYRVHRGFPGDYSMPENIYRSEFSISEGRSFRQVKDEPADAVFLVNAGSHIPPIALALQRLGHARIVAEGETNDKTLVSREVVPFGEGLEVIVRTSELLRPGGGTGFMPDIVLEPSADPRDALDAALAFVRTEGIKSELRQAATPAVIAGKPDEPYPEMRYPERAYRLIALYRLWNYVNYFFAYKSLISQPWEGRLAEYVPRFLGARDEKEYVLTAAELVARMEDGHAVLRDEVVRDYIGSALAPVTAMFIENRFIVIHVLDVPEARGSGIAVGDEIVAVDGIPVEQRVAAISPYLSASNHAARMHYVAAFLLAGPDGTDVELQVKGADEALRTVRLPRSDEFERPWLTGWREGDIVKVLDGNIGYVDLDRLRIAGVDAMFESLKTTRAIIFDMRGYPHGTVWPIGPRLGLPPEKIVAENYVRIARPADDGETQIRVIERHSQAITAEHVPWIYEKPTVTLVDVRAQSHAEHSGLILDAVNTVFIGSQTAGANGNVSFFRLPGDLQVRYTGLDVRYPDGRQLQRKGLAIDIPAAPTIEGIREGRDEVLERAIEYVNQVVQ